MKQICILMLSIVFFTGCQTPFVDGAVGDEKGYAVDSLTEPESLYYDASLRESMPFASHIYRTFEMGRHALTELPEALASVRASATRARRNETTWFGDEIGPLMSNQDFFTLDASQAKALLENAGYVADVREYALDRKLFRVITICFSYGKSENVVDPFEQSKYIFLQTNESGQLATQPLSEHGWDLATGVQAWEEDSGQFLLVTCLQEFPRDYYAEIGYLFSLRDGYWKPCAATESRLFADHLPADATKRLEGYVRPLVAE